MYYHRTLLWALVASSIMPLAIGGCMSVPPSDPNNSNQNNSKGLPKSVVVAVHDDVEQPTGVKIFVSIAVDSGGIPIHLVGVDTLYCNGTALVFDDTAGLFKCTVAQIASGGRYNFSLKDSSGLHFLCDVPVHERPQISAPIAGSAVTRSGSFRILYVPDQASLGIASTVRGNPMTLTPETFEADNGSSAFYDVLTLPAGPGWVQIIRHYQATHADLGFKTIEANYYVGKISSVTWL